MICEYVVDEAKDVQLMRCFENIKIIESLTYFGNYSFFSSVCTSILFC